MQGLVEIFRATKSKRKYFHLFKMLEDAGIIELPTQLEPKVFSENMTGVDGLIRKIKVITPIKKSKVVYLQPIGEGADIITFEEFGGLIGGIDDPTTHRFIESLKKWSIEKPGDGNV